LSVTPVIVSPSSSTAQSSNIIVNIPTLPFVTAASIADSSDVSSECSSDDSDVSTSSEGNDVEQQEEEEERASVDLSCGSSSDSSNSSEFESEDDDDEGVEEKEDDYNPTVAKLEISLLRAKLKLAKLEYLRHCERNPTTVVVVEGEDKGEKTECDDLWKWEERKASVDKLVAARRKASFEKDLVRVYVAEVVDEVVVVEEEKPCSYLESIE